MLGTDRPPPLIVDAVGHSFGGTPALDGCSFVVPAGAVVALLGRNGAGKTTLMRAVAGLLRPLRGQISVFGRPAGAVLPRWAYVDQRAPLYPMLTVAQTLRLGARLNPGWDAAYATRVAEAGALPADARVGTLAAGQRSWLAFAMALGKRAGLLVLDEPMAGLDPVARAEFTSTLMAEVADRGTAVLMSSHVVADIEGVCDHVVVLGGGRVRLAAEVDRSLDEHRVAAGAVRDIGELDGLDVVELRRYDRDFTALVRAGGPRTGALSWHRPSLEELLLAYLRLGAAPRPAEEVVTA